MTTFSFKAGYGFKSARREFSGRTTATAHFAWAKVRHEMTDYGSGHNSRAYASQANFDSWKAFAREIGRRCGKAAAEAIEAYIAKKAQANGFSSD
jgi:hypothetical protein